MPKCPQTFVFTTQLLIKYKKRPLNIYLTPQSRLHILAVQPDLDLLSETEEKYSSNTVVFIAV